MALAYTIPGGTVQLSGNPILIKVTGAVAPVGSTNFEVMLRVTSLDGQVKGGPWQDAVAPDAAGAVKFNISRLVDKPHEPLFEFPLLTASYGYVNAIWNIRVEIGVKYIDSNNQLVIHYHADDAAIPEGQNINIIKGGISDHQRGIYNEADTTFYAQVIAKGKFLTNQPNSVKVGPNQPVKLFLISPYAENTFIDVITTAYYADGSSQDFTEASEIYLDGMFEYTMHPAHVGLPTNKDGSPMVRFTIEWGDPDTVGDLREYIVDWTYYENETYVWFANSKGALDIVRFTGAVKRAIETTATEGIRPLDETSRSRTPEILTTAVTGRKKFTINTGTKEPEEIEALEDLYLSKNIWIQVGARLYPVTIEAGETELFDSENDIPSRDLVFKGAYNKRFM